MKRSFAIAMCVACFSAFWGCAACARQIPLAELNQQIPERLQMTVTTEDGKIIEVDAPIVMPEGDKMPVVLTKYATFNTLDIHELYPTPAWRDQSFINASKEYEKAMTESFSIYLEEKSGKLSGKVDYSGRYLLPDGSTPLENDVAVEEIMAFLYENIERFDCDTELDIRVERAIAMSGLCRMKSQKRIDPSGVSWRVIAPDPEQSLKNGSKGSWSLRLSQYMYGAEILGAYLPYGSTDAPNPPHLWYHPNHLYAEYLDEKNMSVGVMAVKEAGIIDMDAALLSYEDVVKCLQMRMKEGKLKSIYGLRLAYDVRIVEGDRYWLDENYTIFNPDTHYVLVPTWQVLGFDAKDAKSAEAQGLDNPSKEAILDPEKYSQYQTTFEVRMDATTGEFILDYESMEFDLSSFEYVLDDIKH